MQRRTILIVASSIFTVLSCIAVNTEAGSPPPGGLAAALPDLVEKVQAGVVNISSTRFVKQYVMRGMPEFFSGFGIPEAHIQKQSSLGSGFIIDNLGYVLTNNHVIENADEVVVTLLDKRRLPAKIIGRDKAMDLALLQIKGGNSVPNLKPTSLGSSEKTRIGESVFAIGNPFGLSHTVTAGIISAKNRAIGIGPFDNFLQTDASINFGNSGGPLFSFNGDVIGINTAINAQGQGLGFAIPIDEAKAHLNELKNYGRIVRSWLGATGENITTALQHYYDLPVDHGVVITGLAERGPAHKAGLRAGDIVLKVNEHIIKDRGDVQRALSRIKPGEKLTLQYNRQGQTLSKTMDATAAPNTNELPAEIF